MKPTTIDPDKMSVLSFGNSRSFLLPGQRNRKRHTWIWRERFFVFGLIIGWLAHGFV